MRIGLVVPGFSADEDDWCIPAVRNFVQQLALGDNVRILALRYPSRAQAYDVFGTRVIAFGGGRRRRIRSAALWREVLFTLAIEHRREPFDVLNGFWATESGFLTAIAGRTLGIPTVISLAGGELVGFRDLGYGDQLRWVQRGQVALALRLADVVTAGSAYLATLARPWLRPSARDRLVRAPLGIDTRLFGPAASLRPENSARLVHVGSLVPVKDQATLLAAVARLRASGLAVSLDIAGSGPRKAILSTLVDDLRIESSVRFLDEVRHDTLPEVYRQGDIFVLSSRHEAQCVAALEAAGCGLPIVGSAVGIVPELAPKAAIPVTPGDPGALADAIGALLSDPERQLRMGFAARQRAESEFDVPHGVDRFRRSYRDALTLRGRSASLI